MEGTPSEGMACGTVLGTLGMGAGTDDSTSGMAGASGSASGRCIVGDGGAAMDSALRMPPSSRAYALPLLLLLPPALPGTGARPAGGVNALRPLPARDPDRLAPSAMGGGGGGSGRPCSPSTSSGTGGGARGSSPWSVGLDSAAMAGAGGVGAAPADPMEQAAETTKQQEEEEEMKRRRNRCKNR